MTREQVARLETDELERWYRLPSPLPPTRTDGLALLGMCLVCAFFVLIATTPRGVY
jgi:hypothetical protein